jgi:hypothetical protein
VKENMANKFQKSVLERLEAEESRRKSAEKLNAAPLPEEHIAPQETEGTPESTEMIAPLPVTVKLPEAPIIGDYISHDTHRVAKNKTFYLDTAVVDAVKRISREQQVTESRLVNDILRGVFGL